MKAGAWLIAFRRRYGSPSHAHPVLAAGEARDYAWAAPKGKAKGEGIPDRSGFGLPLPFGEGGETVTWGDPESDGRRASPLLIKVARFAAGTEQDHAPVFTFLPARLIPAGESLYLKKRPDSGEEPGDDPAFLVGRFLDLLCEAPRGLASEIPR
jgi:hypothetical protein